MVGGISHTKGGDITHEVGGISHTKGGDITHEVGGISHTKILKKTSKINFL